MAAASLVIQKLVVDVFIDEHPVPVSLLNETTHSLMQVVLPMIEKEINQVTLPNQSVRIPKMEVEVKSDSLNTWTTDFSTAISRSISEACYQVVVPQTAQMAASATEKSTFSITGETEVIDEKEQLFALLCFFLLNGYLPWWKSVLGIRSFKEIEQAWLQAAEKEELFLRLKQFLIKHPKALLRLINQAGKPFLNQLIDRTIADSWNDFTASIPAIPDKSARFKCGLAVAAFNTMRPSVEAFFLVVKELTADPVVMQELESFPQLAATTFRELVVELGAQRYNRQLSEAIPDQLAFIEKEGDALLATFMQQVSRDPEFFQAIMPSLDACIAAAGTIPVTLRDWLATIPGLGFHSPEVQRLLAELEQAPKAVIPEKSNQMLATLKKLPCFSPAAKSETLALTVEEPVYTANAGVVLLHPFLPTLFKNLGLLDQDHKWCSVEQQLEAIYWIHYLATGNTDPSEDELVTARLLAGFPLAEVMPVHAFGPDSAFTKRLEDEKTAQELTDLLQVVRDNWRPMRNCTWEGLRNDFLNRSARIHQTSSMQYVLTVEPHSFDVLLPFKEWGISMIKYSWMDEVLYVEWG